MASSTFSGSGGTSGSKKTLAKSGSAAASVDEVVEVVEEAGAGSMVTVEDEGVGEVSSLSENLGALGGAGYETKGKTKRR